MRRWVSRALCRCTPTLLTGSRVRQNIEPNPGQDAWRTSVGADLAHQLAGDSTARLSLRFAALDARLRPESLRQIGAEILLAKRLSTVTAYVESAAGVAAGARTGVANLVTAAGFLGALFCAPLVRMIGGGVAVAGGAVLQPLTAPEGSGSGTGSHAHAILRHSGQGHEALGHQRGHAAGQQRVEDVNVDHPEGGQRVVVHGHAPPCTTSAYLPS